MLELLLCALNKTLSDLPVSFMECFYTKRTLKKIRLSHLYVFIKSQSNERLQSCNETKYVDTKLTMHSLYLLFAFLSHVGRLNSVICFFSPFMFVNTLYFLFVKTISIINYQSSSRNVSTVYNFIQLMYFENEDLIDSLMKKDSLFS